MTPLFDASTDYLPAEAGGTPFLYIATDDLDDDQRWSTWSSVERGQRGPQPRPSWVVTDDAAIDTELGLLKTGKEAEVFVLERAVPGDPTRFSLLAAKRYRSMDHRSFHRSAAYTEGRRTRRTRDARAIAKGTAYGREAASGQWAWAEFETLSTLWSAGAAVPYPVQVDGTELLMELVTVDGAAAPRLAQARPDKARLADWYDQLRNFIGLLARLGWAHGDLSAYNILAVEDRVVVIDLPQVVDLVANPQGMDFLQRDCRNVCSWFNSRGLDVHEGELFADAVAQAFG
jgi:RIO kinase 1